MDYGDEQLDIDRFLHILEEQDYTFTRDELKAIVQLLEKNL